jgi:long-chain acyl-CoA synthetase
VNYRNLTQLHRCQAERLGPRPALGFRRYGLYGYRTWEQYRAEALACAAALVDAGVQVGDRVGLLAENRLEWLLADMGILAAGGVNVPPHVPLTARQVQFQFADADVRALFVSTREQLQKILLVRNELPLLRAIVVFDAAAVANEPGIETWSGFLQRGRRALAGLTDELVRREAAVGPDDLATIMYTSGTTGTPKGVMLTHHNLLSNAVETVAVSPHLPDDVVLNWLPFSHIYARTVDHYQCLAAGVLLCLADCLDTLVRDLEEIRPTHLASVPRFYEKLLTGVASPDSAKVRRRLQDIFGPRMRWLSSGGAPLPPLVAEIYAGFGFPLFQGYGLTESSPVITFNRPERNKVGTVGLPVPGVEVALAPDGEVLTRGPHVMKGYWKNPQATAAALRDGWLHTGDLGSLDAEGFLTITGRKKDLLVLSNGKKVVPTHLEGLLLGDECIDQAVVFGEGRSFLTALVVPHWDNLRRALTAEGRQVKLESNDRLAQLPIVQELLRARIDRALADVSNWEQIRKFAVLTRPFSVADDELTVSLKLRRSVILTRYRDVIEGLYV